MMFKLNRDQTVSGTVGHTIEFKKGEATHVPPDMYTAVLSIGAEPLEGVDEKEDKKKAPPPMDVAERRKQLLTGMEVLANENDSKKFTGTGMPQLKALKDVLGFEVDQAEVKTVWAEYLQSKG